MIDTDKYEGHTEGEWMFDSRDWNWAINIFGNNGKTIEANAILIQDAPLLLAEVKKIRGLIKKSLTFIECIPRTSDTLKLKFLINDLQHYVLHEGDEEE